METIQAKYKGKVIDKTGEKNGKAWTKYKLMFETSSGKEWNIGAFGTFQGLDQLKELTIYEITFEKKVHPSDPSKTIKNIHGINLPGQATLPTPTPNQKSTDIPTKPSYSVEAVWETYSSKVNEKDLNLTQFVGYYARQNKGITESGIKECAEWFTKHYDKDLLKLI